MAEQYSVVFVTAPRGKAALKLANSVVRSRTAACVNVLPGIKSIYWWKGKIENSAESLLVIKTRRTMLKNLFKVVKSNHPYSVPEIIAMPISVGYQPYLRWIKSETGGRR